MITLVCGPMFSGKTSEMLRQLERAYMAKKKVVLLRPQMDSRPFLSHSPKDISWLEEQFVENIAEFDAFDYDVIGIDEGQFQQGLTSFCLEYSQMGKKIVVSALHATSECEMFEPIVNLVPYCDEIVKLNAVCTNCGSELGSYTKYLAGDKTDKVAVGGSEEYTARCAACYFRKDL